MSGGIYLGMFGGLLLLVLVIVFLVWLSGRGSKKGSGSGFPDSDFGPRETMRDTQGPGPR